MHGALALNVAGVERGLGFQQHHVSFLVGGRKVFDAARDDEELARVDDDFALGAVLVDSHPQRALHHEEQLIFIVMVMPHELALELHNLHIRVVQLAHDLRTVLIGEQRKLLREIDLLHHELLRAAKPSATTKFIAQEMWVSRGTATRCSAF